LNHASCFTARHCFFTFTRCHPARSPAAVGMLTSYRLLGRRQVRGVGTAAALAAAPVLAHAEAGAAARVMALRPRSLHATAAAQLYFKRMELEVWFDKWQYHCTTDIGESAVKWKTIKELDVDLEKIELRYGHHTGAGCRHDLSGTPVPCDDCSPTTCPLR
jgi:hypothetical protein